MNIFFVVEHSLKTLLIETKTGIAHLNPLPIILRWVIIVDEKTPLKEGSSNVTFIEGTSTLPLLEPFAWDIIAIICFKLATALGSTACKASTKEGVVAISLSSFVCIKINGRVLKHENRR